VHAFEGDEQTDRQLQSTARDRKTNSVHSRAARKHMVAVILSILNCMFYSRSIIEVEPANMGV